MDASSASDLVVRALYDSFLYRYDQVYTGFDNGLFYGTPLVLNSAEINFTDPTE
jgi:hypothetical protein